jgi:uncharacterized protein YqgC (DUF456 family)
MITGGEGKVKIILQVLLWTGVSLFLVAGLAGSVVPALPGPPLVFAGALCYGLFTGFAEIGWLTLVVLAALAALAQLLDYLASAYGARRLGGTKWGMWGSVLGGILGFVAGSIIGMIVGLFAGAFLLEWWKGNKKALASLRVGGGSLLGFLGGTLMKVIFSLLMIGIFLFDSLR